MNNQIVIDMSDHGNTGNKHAAKPEDQKVSTARLNVTLPNALKTAVEQSAKEDGSKVNPWVREALEEKLARRKGN